MQYYMPGTLREQGSELWRDGLEQTAFLLLIHHPRGFN